MKEIKHKELIILFSRNSELDNLAKLLEDKKLYDNSFLYTVVDGERIDELKQQGTYRKGNDIFACQKDEIIGDRTEDGSIEGHLIIYNHPAIVVWKKDEFERSIIIPSRYSFQDPENKVAAIEAIVSIEMEQNWKFSDIYDVYR